jgi:hypothetical protein
MSAPVCEFCFVQKEMPRDEYNIHFAIHQSDMQRILDYLTNNGESVTSQLALQLDLPVGLVDRYLEKLANEKKIILEGISDE